MDKFEFHRDKENRIVCEPRETVGKDKHFHNCMEFIYAIDGEADAYIDGIEYHFSSGQICAVSCFAIHYYKVTRNGTYLVCLIPRRYFRESDHFFNGNSFKNPIVTDSDPHPLLHIFQQIQSIAYHRDIWGNPTGSISVDSVDSQLCHLSSYLVRTFIDHCGLYERKRISALVADAVGVIETHFKEHINVSVICQMLNCSSQDLSANFKKTLDMSILEYIERTRLIEAVRLLQQYPNLTNEQIMQESGYRSPRTFLRHFRDTYHCTPAEYKAKYAQN